MTLLMQDHVILGKRCNSGLASVLLLPNLDIKIGRKYQSRLD